MADLQIKRWNGTSWEVDYPETTVGQLITTGGTPSETTFLNGLGAWATPAGGGTGDFIINHLTADVLTAEDTAAVEVFNISLPIGKFHFEVNGTTRKTGTTSKAAQVIFTCDSTTGYAQISALAIFSINTNTTANTGSAMSLFNATRITAVSSNVAVLTNSSYFQGTTNTSAISNMPFIVNGIIRLTSARNFRMHIRQTAGALANTSRVVSGTYIKITRVE